MFRQIELQPQRLHFINTPYLERNQRFLGIVTPESKQWLSEYERQEKNIFNYYSINNEINFIKKTKDLPPDQYHFYLHENVKRFLAEFVGKVPYTTIPYCTSDEGFDYAGMKVLDSYQRAARIGGDREKAEIDGFTKIEQEIKNALQAKTEPSAAFWISPPKNWDYGFVFVFIPDAQSHIREYVLRYDEPRTTLTMSSYLMNMLGDTTYQNTDDFLRHPLFFDKNGASETLDIVMRTIGIDEGKIAKSRQFEQHIDTVLSPGIDVYIKKIMEAAHTEKNGELIIEAKLLLIQLYRQAEQIKAEMELYSSGNTQTCTPTPTYQATQVNYAGVILNAVYLDKGPLVSGDGSCPSLQDMNPNPFSQTTPIFTSNFDYLRKLQRGPLESFFKNTETHFACPLCGTLIPSGQGITECPNKPACGITKDQYAAMISGIRCD